MTRLCFGFLALLCAAAAFADPCGMVPPIDPRPGAVPQISRIGVLQTYAFHKGDLETFVIRPGFRGKVEDFGMLISFPNPPSLRKVPDDVFAQVAAAIDPPEVVLYPFRRYEMEESMKRAAPSASGGVALERDEVRVIREEAVGMYEVVVLEAGSASALKRWMDEHKYVFPKGMEAVCEEYVKAGWCFVAERARVGSKKGADASPGQRVVNANKPPEANFDGYLQGMEFRFTSKELMLPMRLSAFNDGSTRNIVYLLSEHGMKIQGLPEKFVKRQLTGEKLYRNLTRFLPLRIVGASTAECRKYVKASGKELVPQLDPEPRNGVGKDLFAGDLLAVKEGRLAHPVEDREKMLLDIGERLDLRGPEIDALNSKALVESRRAIVGQSLTDISQMTMTVIDGDFPRDLLAKDNLQFVDYTMPASDNNSSQYDATAQGPRPAQAQGYLVPPEDIPAGKSSPETVVPLVTPVAQSTPTPVSFPKPAAPAASGPGKGLMIGAVLASCALLGLSRPRSACVVFLIGLLGSRLLAQSEDSEVARYLSELETPTKYAAAVRGLIKRGPDASPALLTIARSGQSLVQRGFAIVCLAEIGGARLDDEFRKLQEGSQPDLVKNWAAAARIKLADTPQKVLKLVPLQNQFPALRRPVQMAIVRYLPQIPLADLLALAAQDGSLQQSLAQPILAAGPEPLVKVLVHDKNQESRRLAAAYLGTLAVQGDAHVTSHVLKAFRFDNDAKTVPWTGGPLYIPALQWNKESAHRLLDSLIRWEVYCQRKKLTDGVTQVENNLRSLQLWNPLGVTGVDLWSTHGAAAWLTAWSQVVGQDGIEEILSDQGLEEDPSYKVVAPRR